MSLNTVKRSSSEQCFAEGRKIRKPFARSETLQVKGTRDARQHIGRESLTPDIKINPSVSLNTPKRESRKRSRHPSATVYDIYLVIAF